MIAHAYTSPALSRVASYIVGHPVAVVCGATPPEQDDGGWVNFRVGGVPDNVIHIIFCTELRKLMLRPSTLKNADTAETAGLAFLTLAHEAEHIRLASLDEALVECTAYTRLAATVAYLPIRPVYRARVLRYALSAHQAQPANSIYMQDC